MAPNMYVKFEGPNLPAGDASHRIEVLSWSHGFHQQGSRGGEHQRLEFTKYLDAQTTELMNANWSGRLFKKATLSCYRSDGGADNKPVQYLTIEMQNVIVARFSISGGAGTPVENVELECDQISYGYMNQKQQAFTATKPGTASS